MDIKDIRKRKIELGLSNELIADLSGVEMEAIEKILDGAIENPIEEIAVKLEETLKEGGLAEQYAPRTLKSVEEDPGLADRIRETSLAYNAEAEYAPLKDEKGRPVKKPGDYTIVDYLNWPEDERVELINGNIYYMAAPYYSHQQTLLEIAFQIRDYIDRKGGDCNVGVAPIDVQLDKDDKTMVQPDVIIDCQKEKRNPVRIIGAPDFVLEVLSDSTRSKDIIIKTEKYMSAGCREYWIVDPDNEQIIVYDFESEKYPLFYTFEDMVPVNIYGGDLEIDFSLIKKKLQDLF